MRVGIITLSDIRLQGQRQCERGTFTRAIAVRQKGSTDFMSR